MVVGGTPVGLNGAVARRKTVVDTRAAKYDRLETWAGLRVGDAIDVDGVAGRGLTFTFMAHVTNKATGESWVEAAGGRSGTNAVRSFRPEQVYAKGTLKKAGAVSLADQPGLPLG